MNKLATAPEMQGTTATRSSNVRHAILTAVLGVSAAVTALAVLSHSAQAALSGTPNIVLIMADDMGYGDPGCYNPDSKIRTPAIDSLAHNGMRFTDAHAPAAVCVPTRYGLLTGRYPFRRSTGRNGPLIENGRMTIASLLESKGYVTACVGKWHLGFEHEKDPGTQVLAGGPIDCGFGTYFGIPASLDIPPYYYIQGDRAVAPPTDHVDASNTPGISPIQGAFWRAGGIAPGFRHVDVLPKFAAKTMDVINAHAERKEGKPLFLYLALPAPHTPWLPTEAYRGKSKAGTYGDFVMQVDAVVGQVLATLKQNNMANDTLVLFTSDNGPVWFSGDVEKYGHRAVGPLKGMKGDVWEGGHRMPFVAKWPGQIAAGSVSDEVICHTDLLATLAAMLNATLPENAGEDSFSLLPVLQGKEYDGAIRPATIHQSSRRVLCLREGPWKLVPALGSGGFSPPRKVQPEPEGPHGQLYNLADDIGETRNLWSDRPDMVKRLSEVLAQYKQRGRSR